VSQVEITHPRHRTIFRDTPEYPHTDNADDGGIPYSSAKKLIRSGKASPENNRLLMISKERSRDNYPDDKSISDRRSRADFMLRQKAE